MNLIDFGTMKIIAISSLLLYVNPLLNSLVDVPSIMDIADKATIIGILAYISYSLNKKLEKQQTAFHDRLEKIQSDFQEEERLIRESFRQDLQKQNDIFQESLKFITQTLKK